MLFGKIATFGAAALLFAPLQATQELPDLARWSEVTLPEAPFRIDVPMPLNAEPDKVIGTSKRKTWRSRFGLLSVEIGVMQRPGPSSFSPRTNLEMLRDGLLKDWKNPSAKITDLHVLGYTAAKVELENDVSTGRLRTERLLIRVGNNDWTVQTTRFLGMGDDTNSAHVFASIAPKIAPPPPLIPATIGRMTINGFGKPIVTVDDVRKSPTYDKWVTYAFDYQGKTKAWIYEIRVKPGEQFDAKGTANQLIDAVVGQSNPKPRVVPLQITSGGLPATFARGQAITGEGKECFRILTIGDGQDGWAMLLQGPNSARTETMFRDMIESIRIAK